MTEEELWQRRLLACTGVRLIGLAIFFLGIATMFTNLVREGGWPQLGAIIAILGVIDAVFTPRLLKKAWDQKDREQE
jgi:hypothetical protein